MLEEFEEEPIIEDDYESSEKSTSEKIKRRSSTTRSRKSHNTSNESEKSENKSIKPFDRIFSKKVNTALMKSTVKVVKLTFFEFKEIDFDPAPSIICDIVEHLTGFKIKESVRIQKET